MINKTKMEKFLSTKEIARIILDIVHEKLGIVRKYKL